MSFLLPPRGMMATPSLVATPEQEAWSQGMQATYGGAAPGAASPFVWGAGGAAITPDELARRRAVAAELLKSNYSPIQSVWQGLGRVADNITGALDERKLDKQETAATARSNAVAQALIGGGGGDVAARALVDPYIDENTRKLAMLQWKQAHPDPTEPHYWETNNGSLGMIGADGQPKIVYDDPTPKTSWITADNGDGTKTLIQVGPNGPITGAQAPVGSKPPTTLPPDFDFGAGGPTPPASGTFHVPSGNPLDPWPR